jgi:integrase
MSTPLYSLASETPEYAVNGESRSRMRNAAAGEYRTVERMTLYHAFHAACERAGIEDYTWHDLRHEAMSRLGERGDMSIIELASISGHKTLQMVKKYTHLDAEKLAKKLG